MTQNQRIIQYLNDFGSITTYEAMIDLGVARLASRIHELRKGGIDIIGEKETAKNRYGELTHYIRYKKCAAVSADDSDTSARINDDCSIILSDNL